MTSTFPYDVAYSFKARQFDDPIIIFKDNKF